MKRLRITSAFVAAAFVFTAGTGPTLAEDKGHVVVASWEDRSRTISARPSSIPS